MSESRIRKTREVAEAVSSILAKGNCRCALIGAGALAVHGYARQSVDLDLATYENPFDSLREIVQRLHDNGYDAELVTPDAEDPLGGVINVTGAELAGRANLAKEWSGISGAG